MRLTLATLLGFLLVVTSLPAFQAGDKLKSGPQAGEPIPGPFHFLNINGAYSGDPHCLVCEYGLRPVAAVFARSLPETGKPLANLLQKLDETIGKNQASEFRGFAAFLSQDLLDEFSAILNCRPQIDQSGSGRTHFPVERLQELRKLVDALIDVFF